MTALYEAYLDEFRRLEQNRRPLAGAFGMGGGPQSYPCHEKFVQDVERLLEKLTAQNPASEQAGQVLTYMYCAMPPLWESEPAVYWTLLAVQGLTAGLIERLSPPEAGALYDAYRDLYPRCRRLPAQKKILAALKTRCGEK